MKPAMKKCAVAIAFCLLAGVANADFWASSQRGKYHNPSCEWAQKIAPANKIVFKTAADARKAGYVPCKVCKPPVK